MSTPGTGSPSEDGTETSWEVESSGVYLLLSEIHMVEGHDPLVGPTGSSRKNSLTTMSYRYPSARTRSTDGDLVNLYRYPILVHQSWTNPTESSRDRPLSQGLPSHL